VRELYPQLSAEEFVFVGLSVETNLRANQLASYADSNGFAWRFAVMTPAMLGAIVDQYGSRSIVPPSTPHFVIAPTGVLSALSLGIHSAADIRAELEATSQTAN
jgi:hypothetical protein